jgi:hypothetical protein
VWRAMTTWLWLPGQRCPVAMTWWLRAQMMLWVLMLRRLLLLGALMDWSCTGMRVPSIIRDARWPLGSGV